VSYGSLTDGGAELDYLVTSTPGASNSSSLPGLMSRAGDCNNDGALDLSDVICLLGHIFQGSPASLPCNTAAANLALMDSNRDGGVDLSDAIYKLTYLFQGGAPPEQGEGCIVMVDCPQNPGCP